MNLLLVYCVSFFGLWLHPVYVSVTNIDVNVPEKQIILSLKIFTDDLETMLHNKYDIAGWIGTKQEHPNSRKLIEAYVAERFTIEINHNEKLNLSTDSISIHEDALWLYMKGISSRPIRYVTIDNRILTDFFRSQTNLVIINTGRDEKGYKLDRDKHKIELSL